MDSCRYHLPQILHIRSPHSQIRAKANELWPDIRRLRRHPLLYSSIKQDPDLAWQIIALLESEWRPAVQAALQCFDERICCSKCSSISEAGKKLKPDGKRRLDSLVLEMERLPVEQLSLRRFRKFRARLGWLEKEYLDANLGKTCGGLV